MNNIIFIIGDHFNGNFCHLGHELNCARSLIFDLLCKEIIIEDETTIITTIDRVFLYNHIFKKTISYEENNNIDLNKFSKIIRLDNDFLSNPRTHLCNKEAFHYRTYNVFKGIYEPIGFNNYKNKNFIKYVTNCNADILEPFATEFIIVHFRNYSNKPDIKCWNYSTDDNIIELINILNSLKGYYTNVLIFGNLNSTLDCIDGLNIKYCNNLKNYVSCMMSKNCNCIISCWSGAGQLGQFFFDKQLIYYMKPSQTVEYKFPFVNYEVYNNNINDIYSWDFQTFSECKRYWFFNITDLINLFNNKHYEKLDLYNKYIGNYYEFQKLLL